MVMSREGLLKLERGSMEEKIWKSMSRDTGFVSTSLFKNSSISSLIQRQLRRDLDKAREDLLMSTQVHSPHLLKDTFYKVSFYKPVVGSR